MSCLLRAPQTPDEWLALIDTCATSAGGPGWASLALTGLLTLALAGLCVVLLAGIVRGAR